MLPKSARHPVQLNSAACSWNGNNSAAAKTINVDKWISPATATTDSGEAHVRRQGFSTWEFFFQIKIEFILSSHRNYYQSAMIWFGAGNSCSILRPRNVQAKWQRNPTTPSGGEALGIEPRTLRPIAGFGPNVLWRLP